VRRILVPEYLPDPQLAQLAGRFEVVYDPDLYGDRPRLLEAIGPAVAIFIRNRTRIDRELLAAAGALKVIGRLGVGMDNVDVAGCEEHGVTVIPATGANAVSVAEYVFGAMLTLMRPVFGLTGSMVEGRWPRQGHAFGRELAGRTLGLVGYGAIARHVARRALAFDMVVLAHDPYVAGDDPAWGEVCPTPFDRLLGESDVVSVHVPLTAETRELIGAEAFALMKPGAVLINTSRGGTVDEAALAEALRNGRLGGAALDVFAVEPLAAAAAERFAGLPDLVLTPHLAGNTVESVDRIAQMTVDAVVAALS
jgi:(S)-sulfolactate dehydrogenase